jgi:hypothetical protein
VIYFNYNFQKHDDYINVDIIKTEQNEDNIVESPMNHRSRNRKSSSTMSSDEEREFQQQNKNYFENSHRKSDSTSEDKIGEDRDSIYYQAEINEKQETIKQVLITHNFLSKDDHSDFDQLFSQFSNSLIIKAYKWLEQEIICLINLKNKYNHYFHDKKRLLWFLQILSAKRFLGLKILTREAWVVIKTISFFKDLFSDFTSRQLTKAARKKILEEDDFVIEDYERKCVLKKDELLELTNMVKGSRVKVRKVHGINDINK